MTPALHENYSFVIIRSAKVFIPGLRCISLRSWSITSTKRLRRAQTPILAILFAAICPIRISVQNGHVELYGTVNSAADKEIAFLRANSVPGIFSVKNFIQVAGQPGGKHQ